MRKKHIKLLLTILIIPFLLQSKPITVNAPAPLEIVPATSSPVIDGTLNEDIWETASTFSEFKTMFPDFGLSPSESTKVYMTYDRTHLYFAIRSFDKDAGKIKTSVTKRDNIGNDDWVSIELDTFNNTQSNYLFKVNPQGIQADGMVDQDENDDLSMDMIWSSKGKIDDSGYVVEMAIPFKSLRMPYRKKIVMGIGIRRSISRKSETLIYPEYDPKQGSRLTQRRQIVIADIKYKRTIEAIPVVTFSGSDNREAGQWNEGSRLRDFGLTAKVGITPTLTLDATYNPDFSHVESDAGQIDVNLRSAIFYREKRSFFLEGNEQFRFSGINAGYFAPLRSIVNTRSIVDPLLGLKLNGKLGTRNHISGIFAVDEYPKELAGENAEGSNALFTILRYKRSLNKDNYIGGFYTGRNHDGGFNRITGLDGQFRLSGKSKFAWHLFGSFDRGSNSEANAIMKSKGDYTTGAAIGFEYSYFTRNIGFNVGYRSVSRDFRTDIGYQTRTGLTQIPFDFRYHFYPKSRFFKKISALYVSQQSFDRFSDMWETFNWTGLEFHFPGQTFLWFGHNLRTEVYAHRRFNTGNFGLGLYTQLSKQVYFDLQFEPRNKIFYDPDNPFQGHGLDVSTSLAWQPTDKFNTAVELSYSDFYRDGDKKKLYDYTILRNRTTFQFNKYLYLRGIVEYNSFYKKIQGDILASFTYIPGTVIQAGYGSVYEKQQWINNRYVTSDNFLHTKKSFFLKASYLWRL